MFDKGIDFLIAFLVAMTISVGICLLFAWFGVLLWNYVMPIIFGLGKITYWQMVALMVLARIILPTNINYTRN